MCLDCGQGSCLSNTSTICVCEEPYTQTRELFPFPPGYTCNFDNPDICLPCNVNEDALFALYLSTMFLDAAVLLGFFMDVTSKKQVKRFCFFLACFTLSLIACMLRAADMTRLFGEDVAFTLIYTYSLSCGVVFVLLLTERFLRYIMRSMRIYRKKNAMRKVLLLIVYSNWFAAACLFGVGTMPVIAAAQDDLVNKAELIRGSFLASGLALLYVQVFHNVVYCKLLKDLNVLIRGNETEKRQSTSLAKYERAKKKIKLQRGAVNVLFGPGAILYSLSFGFDEVYELIRYILPLTSLVGAAIILFMMIKLRSYRRAGRTPSETSSGDRNDVSYTRLVTL